MTIRDLIDSGKISLDTVVLGELPMTADGVVAGLGTQLWWFNRHGVQCISVLPERTDDCWTTRQAAERAAKEGK